MTMHATDPDPIDEIGLDDQEFRSMHGASPVDTLDAVVDRVSVTAISRASRLLAAGIALSKSRADG